MEDTKGIPDVAGLGAFVAANTEQPGSEAVPAQQKAMENTDLGQFKNPQDLMKSYKEIQGYTTRVAQENKALQEQMSQMQEQMRLMQVQAPAQQQQVPIQDFDTQFINNPKQAIDNVVNQRVMETVRTMTVQEILTKEQLKNPDEFHDRYQYAMRARQMYPNLVNTSAGVETLFQIGDKMRNSDLKRTADKAMKTLFGQDLDYEKFKALIQKDQGSDPHANNKDLAYMPDTSGAFRTGPPSGNTAQSRESAISDAVQKGDADAVLKNLFEKALKT